MENPDEVVTPTYIPGTVSIAPAVCVGDVDGNGFVNRADIIALISYLVDNASPPIWSVPCP
jgi:hypothetical protein